jgi:G3E family GTPase
MAPWPVPPRTSRSYFARTSDAWIDHVTPAQVTVLNGFLGAGKTTMLKSLLQQAAQPESPYRVAVIANDMSDLDVDGDVIANSDLVGGERHNFISIATGSIASRRLIPAFRTALQRLIAEDRPTHILVETSGSTHPWPLIEALRQMETVRLHGFLSMVDSVMMQQDYAQGRAVITGLRRNMASGKRGVENLLAEQIMFANRVVLTKIDRLPDGALQQIGQAIHPLNPFAAIVGTKWGGLRLAEVLDLPPYHFHRVAQLGQELASDIDDDGGLAIAEPDSYDIGYRVLNDPRPFPRGACGMPTIASWVRASIGRKASSGCRAAMNRSCSGTRPRGPSTSRSSATGRSHRCTIRTSTSRRSNGAGWRRNLQASRRSSATGAAS